MTEEEKEQKFCCMCLSRDYKTFLSILLGSFIGVFFALSLFAAVQKPYCCSAHHPSPIYSTFDVPQHYHQK